MKILCSGNQRIKWGIIVAAMAALCYLAMLKNEFLLWDDDHYIIDNPHIRTIGWPLIKWAFTTCMQGNWHPLAFLSHAVDYAIWGLNPAGHHATSLIIHTCNSLLVVLLVARIVDLYQGDKKGRGCPASTSPLAVAVVTGILFAIHPLHVESVAWASERKDILCALFYLAALYCYCNPAGLVGIEPGFRTMAGSKSLLMALFFFFLALMSKPMAVSLPLVLLLADRYLLRRIESAKQLAQAVLEKLPFIIPALAISIVTLIAQKQGVTTNHAESIPFASRMLVAAQSLAVYLLKLVVPVGLLPLYPYPTIREISLAAFSFLVPVLVLLGCVVLLFRTCRRQAWWQPLFLYYIITLLPVIGIVQVGAQSMADRYLYLPSLAPFILVAVAGTTLWRKIHARKGLRWLFGISCIAYGMFLIMVCQKQLATWRNSLVFWSSIIAKEPSRVPFAYINRGVAYHKQGDLDKALTDLNRAVALMPHDFDALNSRGAVLMEKGALDNALADFDRAISLGIANNSAYYNRGMLFQRRGNSRLALKDLSVALVVDPFDVKVLDARGQLLQEMGSLDEALADFNAALSVDPSDVMTYNNRGLLFAAKGEIDRAIADYDTAAALNPEESRIYINRGMAWSVKGAYDRALLDFDLAIRLKPDESKAYNNRGIAKAQQGLVQAALDDFTRALELDPGVAEVRVNRGVVLMKMGAADLARKDFVQACRLGEKKGCEFLR